MKKFLLACFLLGTALAGQSQLQLNEVYTTAPQWVEIHNTSSSPAPIACYTLVVPIPGNGNNPPTGFYTLTFPSTTPDVAANGYFLTGPTATLTYTVGTGQNASSINITPDVNWNSGSGLIKKYSFNNQMTGYNAPVSAGNTMGATNGSTEFLSTKVYDYLLFDNNGNYVSGFIGNNTSIPSFITTAPSPLPISSVNGCTVNINFSTVTAAKTGFVTSATGSDNGYANIGECGSWGKTSTNPAVTPDKPNPPKVDGNGNYQGTLTTTASFYCSALRYTISGGTAPYTVTIYNDVNANNILDAVDTYNTSFTTSSSSGSISGITSGQTSNLIIVYRDATGCIGAVNGPAVASGTLNPTINSISCDSKTVTFTLPGTTDASGAVDYSFLLPVTASLYFGSNATPVKSVTVNSFSSTTTYTITGYTVPADVSSPTLTFTTSAGCTNYDKSFSVPISTNNITVGGQLGTIQSNGQRQAFYWLDPSGTGSGAYSVTVTMYEDANNDGRVDNGETAVASHQYLTAPSGITQLSGFLNSPSSDIIVIGASDNTANTCTGTFYTAALQAPLPVHFITFSAVRKDDSKVSLSWTTATEQNNRGFYVQRNDGSGWKDVAFVFSQAQNGNSTQELSYSYSDLNPNKGVSQYRILQVDLDGKGRYSSIVAVHGSAAAGGLVLFPNPSSTGSVTLLFTTPGSKTVIVSDVAGRIVQQFKNVMGNSLQLTNLSSGFYTVQVRDAAAGTNDVAKFIIKMR